MNFKSTLLIVLAAVALTAPLSATPVTLGQCAGPAILGCPAPLDVFDLTNPGQFVVGQSSSVTGVNAQGTILYTGSLRSAVYRNLSTGTLDFFYQYKNDSTSPDPISRLTMTNFAGFTTDIGYSNQNFDGGGNAQVNFRVGDQSPLFGERSSASTVGFSFGTGSSKIQAGEDSSTLVIRTNATNYLIGSTSVINGATTNLATYAPSNGSQVPEPGTYALLGAGLFALGLIRRQKA